MPGSTFAITHHAFSSGTGGTADGDEATGAPQKHHYTLNQQVGSITRAQNEISEHIDSFLDKNNMALLNKSDFG